MDSDPGDVGAGDLSSEVNLSFNEDDDDEDFVFKTQGRNQRRQAALKSKYDFFLTLL